MIASGSKMKDSSLNSKGMASSSASRFYDNGAETSSSISENFYDSQDKIKIPYPPSSSNSIGFKASVHPQTPSHKGSLPPPTQQRSSKSINFFFYC